MNVIEGTGLIVEEPDWKTWLTDELEVAAAGSHWRRVTSEMREKNTLSATNGHSVFRLVMAYMIYDSSARIVAEQGAVTKPRRGNTKAIARVSPHFTAMREAASDAAALEAELGLAPRRRAAAAKVERKARVARASDEFLGKAAR